MTDPAAFANRYPFPLDTFQLDAIGALHDGGSVLVAAPTGAGKTVVAEYAVERALAAGRKCFYTTPLKALSNQKFGDFVSKHGADRVGLLTGDNVVNGEAPIVVMTTEVLRNMLYEGSGTLDGLQTVVMDEVHYLQDPYRGGVWEEVLIHLPLSVAVACLSATISNAEEFGEWVGTLRGPTKVVIEERRPIPLEHHYLVGRDLHPMHTEVDGAPVPNPYLVSLDQQELRIRRHRRDDGSVQSHRSRRPREGHRRVYTPRREDVVDVLSHAGMLPAIYFVFSRAGCARSVEWLMASGTRLTSPHEAERIRQVAEERAAWLDAEDLDALGYGPFVEALAAGVAAHHAGMLPVFKETVEDLFAEGLVKVVFATETLSLGINMPAKTVVIEDLWKFQGERHEMLTPGQYTQLTGRAGRRGIDEIGHAVVAYQSQVPFEKVASLASTRTYELTSSFRPSYNMAVNLVRNYTRDQSHRLLNGSFAQFLADRSVVSQEHQMSRDEEALAGYRANLRCDRGDFLEYWELRTRASRDRRAARGDARAQREEELRRGMSSLRPGDVVYMPRSRRRGLAVVLASRDGRPTVLTQDRTVVRVHPRDFDEAPMALARIPLPRSGSARSARFRRDVAARLVALDIRPAKAERPPKIDPEPAEAAARLQAEAEEHPCHSCPDREQHERWAGRADRLAEQIAGLERRVRARTETLARQFDRVLSVLEGLGYVEGFTIRPKGEMLARIYGEADILVTEAIADGALDGLSASETAAVVSAMVYESRDRIQRPSEMPTPASRSAAERLGTAWQRIRAAEDANQVELCRELDPGFSSTIFAWAEGKPLEDVLIQGDMAPGDFVRTCKQLLDLLRQIADVAPEQASRAAAAARDAVNRGVIAYTGVEPG